MGPGVLRSVSEEGARDRERKNTQFSKHRINNRAVRTHCMTHVSSLFSSPFFIFCSCPFLNFFHEKVRILQILTLIPETNTQLLNRAARKTPPRAPKYRFPPRFCPTSSAELLLIQRNGQGLRRGEEYSNALDSCRGGPFNRAQILSFIRVLAAASSHVSSALFGARLCEED